MKNKIYAIMVWAMIIMITLSGCADSTATTPIESSADNSLQSSTVNTISVDDLVDSDETKDFSKYDDNTETVTEVLESSQVTSSATTIQDEGEGWDHYDDSRYFDFIDEDGDGRDDETGLDKYLTDEIPEGKPDPVDKEDAEVDESKTLTATLSIRIDTLLDNLDILDEELHYMLEEAPLSEGLIFEGEVEFFEGESAFDILLRETRDNKIHMEFVETAIYGSAYIEGIHNIYELSAGPLSGWMYSVNNWYPNYGISRYEVQDGDNIELNYTCDLGRDLDGADWLGGSGQGGE